MVAEMSLHHQFRFVFISETAEALCALFRYQKAGEGVVTTQFVAV